MRIGGGGVNSLSGGSQRGDGNPLSGRTCVIVGSDTDSSAQWRKFVASERGKVHLKLSFDDLPAQWI